jgi:hypothetical protein
MEREFQVNNQHIMRAHENLRQAKEILGGASDVENRVPLVELKERVDRIEDPQEKIRSQQTLQKIQEIREKLK